MDTSRRKGNKGVAAIDDAEIKGYLNTKKEMIYKNIIWEILNKKYLQANTQNQKQKLPRKEKKITENEVAAKRKKKVDDEIESKRKKKKQMLSLKVNFDVLNKQDDDGDEGGKEEKNENENENENENAIVESEENYDDDEEVDYGDVNDYGGIEEDDEEGYNFDEDY